MLGAHEEHNCGHPLYGTTGWSHRSAQWPPNSMDPCSKVVVIGLGQTIPAVRPRCPRGIPF